MNQFINISIFSLCIYMGALLFRFLSHGILDPAMIFQASMSAIVLIICIVIKNQRS